MGEYYGIDRDYYTFINCKSSRWVYMSGEVDEGRHAYDTGSVYFMSFNNQSHVQLVTESFANYA